MFRAYPPRHLESFSWILWPTAAGSTWPLSLTTPENLVWVRMLWHKWSWRLIKCSRCRWWGMGSFVCAWVTVAIADVDAAIEIGVDWSNFRWSFHWILQLGIGKPLVDIGNQYQPNDCLILFERCEWFSRSPAFQHVEQFAKLSDPFSCKGEDTRNLLVSECDLRLGDSWLFIEHPNVSGSGVFRDVFEGRQNGHDAFEQLLCWQECNSVINHDLKNYFGPKIKLKRLKVAA